MAPKRVVLDTNAIISRLLSPHSTPGHAVDHALFQHHIITSDATLMELADVLSRSKFDRYVTISERQDFLRLFNRIAERIEVVRIIRACRAERRQIS